MTAVEVTADGTATVIAAASPHGQLLAAFAQLKKEKDALAALILLQKQENEELKAKLELKAVSAECQIEEMESFSKDVLDTAVNKNATYSEKIDDMEAYIAETNKEKNSLLQRTASLARRDQIQKTTISTLSTEIEILTHQVKDFEEKFSTMATRSADLSYYERRDNVESETATSKEWVAEKKRLTDRITSLEKACNEMLKSEEIMKNTFVSTLSKHEGDWRKEKASLKKQITDLIAEKESIEEQVKEIAELLEREHFERHGQRFEEEQAEESIGAVKEPVGLKTNSYEVYKE